MSTLNNFKSLGELSKLDYITETHIQGMIGDINNPLLNLPLKNNLDMICGDGSVTFTRSTTATYIDRYGVVKSAAINIPRFEKEGLLIEGTNTNKILYSEEFDNSSWTKSRCTISSTATTAPDGTTTADGIIANTDSYAKYVYQNVSSNATQISGSCFAKKGDKDLCMLRIYIFDASFNVLTQAYCWFDLDNGAVGTENNCSGNITQLDDGWFLCSLIADEYTGETTVDKIRLEIFPAELDGVMSFTGDDTTINTYIWGAQLEEFPFSTSYIPTTTAAVTRTADFCCVTYDKNMPAKNTEEFTVICDVSLIGHLPLRQCAWWIRGHSYQLLYPSHTSIENNHVYFFNGSGNANIMSDFAVNVNQIYKYITTFDKITNRLYINGEFIDDEIKTVEITGTPLYIDLGHGSVSGGSYDLYGHISNFKIYDKTFSENEIKLA